jgi:hypothetical protein
MFWMIAALFRSPSNSNSTTDNILEEAFEEGDELAEQVL